MPIYLSILFLFLRKHHKYKEEWYPSVYKDTKRNNLISEVEFSQIIFSIITFLLQQILFKATPSLIAKISFYSHSLCLSLSHQHCPFEIVHSHFSPLLCHTQIFTRHLYLFYVFHINLFSYSLSVCLSLFYFYFLYFIVAFYFHWISYKFSFIIKNCFSLLFFSESFSLSLLTTLSTNHCFSISSSLYSFTLSKFPILFILLTT